MLKIKSKAVGFTVLLGAMVLLAADKPKLVKIKVNKEITVSIPQGWRPMDAMDFTQRYPSVRAPLAAYTDEERMVDFSINVSATQWPDGDLEISKRFFKASLGNLFDRVDIIDEGIKEIHNKKYVFLEFEARINGNRQQEGTKDPVLRYSYIQYLIEPTRTLVFSFNCPRRKKDEWQETAREMMDEIKVK